MTKPTSLETALHAAAELLYSWEQKVGLTGEPNVHRQALDRCARDAGFDNLDGLYNYVDCYWRDQDELWQGVYP